MTTLSSLFHTFTKKDDTNVGTCIANDGYGRQCQNKRLPNCLYCSSCWQETRPIGLNHTAFLQSKAKSSHSKEDAELLSLLLCCHL